MSTTAKTSGQATTQDQLASASPTIVSTSIILALQNTVLALPPLATTLYFLLKNPTFAKSTGPSARAALVMMPLLFTFALTAEQEVVGLKRIEGSRIMSGQNSQNKYGEKLNNTSIENFSVEGLKNTAGVVPPPIQRRTSKILMEMYQREFHAPVRITKNSTLTDSLPLYERCCNYLHSNPFKILGLSAIPIVAAIGSDVKGKDIKFSQKVMHVRVIAQASGVTLLLGLMGFKSYMDTYGRFVSEEDVVSELDAEEKGKRDLDDFLKREKAKGDKVIRERAERTKKVEALVDEEKKRMDQQVVQVGEAVKMVQASE